MEFFEINPFVRYCHRIPHPRPNPRNSDEFVRAYDARLFFVLEGSGEFTVVDMPYRVSENSLLYIPSGTPYRLTYTSDDPITAIVVNFDFDQSHNTHTGSRKPEFAEAFNEADWFRIPEIAEFASPISVSDAHASLPLLSDIERELAAGNPHAHVYASSLLRIVLIELLRQKDAAVNAESSLSLRIKAYLSRHYAENITAESLGVRFGYHPYHLNRVFTRQVGSTLHQYLIELRIRMAKNMLQSTELTLEEIAAAVGISGQTYFSYCFKKSVGLSPSDYRLKKGIRFL